MTRFQCARCNDYHSELFMADGSVFVCSECYGPAKFPHPPLLPDTKSAGAGSPV